MAFTYSQIELLLCEWFNDCLNKITNIDETVSATNSEAYFIWILADVL